MVRLTALILSLALVAGTATAASDFASYDGNDAVREGQGGTKVTTDGVEFWTSGAPPHRYRVLGVLTDSRSSGVFSGSATGSSVAKHIRSLGGDAAILMSQDSQVRGAFISNGVAGVIRRNTTQLLVVKYQDPAP
jgi:hypothetical protein